MRVLAEKDHRGGEQHGDGFARRESPDPRLRDRREVIGRQCAELGGQLGAARSLELIGVQLDVQSIPARGGQDLTAFLYAENARLAEHVATARQLLACHSRNHLLTHELHIRRALAAILGWHLVGAEKGWDQRRGQLAREPLDHPQLLELCLQLQAVPRFHLDRRRSPSDQRRESGPCQGLELRFGPAAHIAH